MKRRNFLLTAAVSVPAAAFARQMKQLIGTVAAGFVIKSGKNRFNEDMKLGGLNPVDIKLSGKDTDGRLCIIEYTGHTKGGPPVHIHPHQDEIFMILEGEQLFQLGDRQYKLTAGDTVFIPRNVPHAPCQLSASSRYISLMTPAGKLEDFFRALCHLKVQGQPSPAQMGKLFETHDMKIVGPPLKF